jgi:hypothetical protein
MGGRSIAPTSEQASKKIQVPILWSNHGSSLLSEQARRIVSRFNPKLAEEGRPNMTFVIAASDAFFERLQNHVRAQRLYQAAIDRDHSFARTFFENLTALAASDSTIAIHDCRPARKLTRCRRLKCWLPQGIEIGGRQFEQTWALLQCPIPLTSYSEGGIKIYRHHLLIHLIDATAGGRHGGLRLNDRSAVASRAGRDFARLISPGGS